MEKWRKEEMERNEKKRKEETTGKWKEEGRISLKNSLQISSFLIPSNSSLSLTFIFHTSSFLLIIFLCEEREKIENERERDQEKVKKAPGPSITVMMVALTGSEWVN